MAKIASGAGVATGTVYLYFKSKEELLARIFDDTWKKLYDELLNSVPRADLTPLQKFDLMMDLLFNAFTENRDLAIVIVTEQINFFHRSPKYFTQYYDKFLDLGEEILREGISKNQFDGEMNVRFFRHFMIGGVRTIILHWADHPDDIPIHIIRQNSKKISISGLRKN
jgi:TetR/AcrR family fatty acid metabolism transcriptional regulator